MKTTTLAACAACLGTFPLPEPVAVCPDCGSRQIRRAPADLARDVLREWNPRQRTDADPIHAGRVEVELLVSVETETDDDGHVRVIDPRMPEAVCAWLEAEKQSELFAAAQRAMECEA